MNATTLRETPKQIRALAGARALPPLLLVLYHYHEGHGYQHFRLFDVFVAKGYLWVEFFFALSGFVLTYVYWPRAKDIWSWRGYIGFLKTRLARLYPVHLAMLLVLLALMIVLRALAHWGGYVSVFDLPSYHPHTGLLSFIANLFLVQAWHIFPHLTWNGVAWFVSVEFFLCLMFPVFLFAARGSPARALMLIALGFVTLHNLAAHSHHGLDITYDWGVVRGLADFAIGVGMAMLHREYAARLDKLPEIAFTAMQAVTFGGFLYAMYNTGWSHQPSDFWVVPGMVLTIGAVAFDRGLLARALSVRPLRRLGDWSYAIYMGQTLWLMLVRFAEQRIYPGEAQAHWVHIAEPIALVILATLWGWALYTYVERPANDWLRARFRYGAS
jgi:peptidoglycan/LPS O-acetylase OafA/YrhL